MEFGPRALGGRSIIGDPRNAKMQTVMNLKIKYRESFRPFAPSVLAERVSDYFEQDVLQPLHADCRTGEGGVPDTADGGTEPPVRDRETESQAIRTAGHHPCRLFCPRADRAQETNPRYHALIKAFEARTGCGVVVNTSFNVRGEPIVCTQRTPIVVSCARKWTILVIENFFLAKEDQPVVEKDDSWQDEFELD